MLSIIFLPSTKPDCSFEIRMGRRGFNILAITFDIILYTKLQREISLNLSGVLASFSLGIKVIRVEFMAFKIEAEHLESSTMP